MVIKGSEEGNISLLVTRTRKPSRSEAPVGMEGGREGRLGAVVLRPERRVKVDGKNRCLEWGRRGLTTWPRC